MALTSLPSRRPVAERDLASPEGPHVVKADLDDVLVWLSDAQA